MNLDGFPRYPRSCELTEYVTRVRLLSWLQAGYTLEEIDVYGVGSGGEEVVVVHKVSRVFLFMV